MGTEAKDFLGAVAKRDFRSSSEILLTAVTSGTTTDIAQQIGPFIEAWDHPSLSVRDHITSFLDLTPLYFAVNVHSLDIIRVFDGTDDHASLLKAVVRWVANLIEGQDPNMKQNAIDVMSIIGTAYASSLPTILDLRNSELESCKIPYSKTTARGKHRVRYNISTLMQSSFGRRLIESAIVLPENGIVGEAGWYWTSSLLGQVGFKPEKMLTEVSQKEWYTFCRRNAAGVVCKDDRKEMIALADLRHTSESLLSPNRETQLTALTKLRANPTFVHNDALVGIVRDGESMLAALALDILETTGDASTVDALSDLVRVQDHPYRTRIARSLSNLASKELTTAREVMESAPYTEGRLQERRQHDSIQGNQIQTLLWSCAPKELLEGMILPADPKRLVATVMTSAAKKLRIMLLKLTELLGDSLSAQIVTYGLADPDVAVRSTAKTIARERWPDKNPDVIEF
ncbi:MAG: hypothetical protein JSW61_01595 [Candidatus Thorarchaeota archaeon]|nr:MAG: hypothetical protein JSW61_01595 [Candidatus Thorarchaeota archaeon]